MGNIHRTLCAAILMTDRGYSSLRLKTFSSCMIPSHDQNVLKCIAIHTRYPSYANQTVAQIENRRA